MMLFVNKNLKKARSFAGGKGFTLVETMIAITILGTAVAATMSIAFQGFRSAQIAQDQLIAIYLAQEGIDLVRTIRDENYLKGVLGAIDDPDWVDGLDECFEPDGCTVDITPIGSLPGDCNSVCPVLNYNASSGLYGYQSGTPSKFLRTITMTSGDPTRTYLVTAVVTWSTGPIVRSFTLRENLMNWTSKY